MSEANPNLNALPVTAGVDSNLPASVITDTEGSATADYIMEFLSKEESEETTETGEPNAAVEGEEPDADVDEDGEEAEASDGSDDSEPDDGSEAELFEVTVNGKAEKVTREELLRGYSRQKDYTIKTEQLAAEKQQVEALKAQHQAALQEALNVMQQDPIIAEAQKLDWAKLALEDPAGFVQKQFQYNQHVAQMQQKQQQFAAMQQESRAKKGQEEAAKLLAAVPEWKDKAKAQEAIKEISETLKGYGFTEQELMSFDDSRAYLVAKDAAAYRRMMAAKATVKEQKVQAPVGKTVKPGATTGNGKQSNSARIKALDARAQRTGSIDDEVEAFMARL